MQSVTRGSIVRKVAVLLALTVVLLWPGSVSAEQVCAVANIQAPPSVIYTTLDGYLGRMYTIYHPYTPVGGGCNMHLRVGFSGHVDTDAHISTYFSVPGGSVECEIVELNGRENTGMVCQQWVERPVHVGIMIRANAPGHFTLAMSDSSVPFTRTYRVQVLERPTVWMPLVQVGPRISAISCEHPNC